MGQESDYHVNRSLRAEVQRRIQHAEDRPEELLDWEDVKREILARRLEAHREHPENVIPREALEAKWQEKWDWKPSL